MRSTTPVLPGQSVESAMSLLRTSQLHRAQVAVTNDGVSSIAVLTQLLALLLSSPLLSLLDLFLLVVLFFLLSRPTAGDTKKQSAIIFWVVVGMVFR